MKNSKDQHVEEKFPRFIFKAKNDPKKDLRDSIDRILSDKFMIFLTILMIPIVLTPIIVSLSEDIVIFLNVFDSIIILIFIVEYMLKLYLAENRWNHFKDKWHILDFIIILLLIIEFFNFFGLGSLSSAPVFLRLLRLPRIFAIGSRSFIGRLKNGSEKEIEIQSNREIEIKEIDEDLKTIHKYNDLEQIKRYYKDPRQEWIDISNISEEDSEKLSEIIGIAPIHIQSRLSDDAHPRIDFLENISLVFLQDGNLKFPDSTNLFLTISKKSILIICSGTNITTISRYNWNIFDEVIKKLQNLKLNKKEMVVGVLFGIFESIITNYKNIVGEIESELFKLEGIPRKLIPKDFLERTFQLKKEITELSSNLMHIKEVVEVISSNRVPLEGFNDNWKNIFDIFRDQAKYLYETNQKSKENLISIIELYINTTSYETNKVMKVLAVITCLSVVPSMIGGLLGQNLLDVPFQAYLWQVVFFTILIMLFIAYIFAKLGWLKN